MSVSKSVKMVLSWAILFSSTLCLSQPTKVISNHQGIVEYESGLPSSYLHFYLLGDGFYQKQMSPTHGFPKRVKGFKSSLYYVDDKDPIPPSIYTTETGETTHNGTGTNPKLNMNPNIDIQYSWGITDYAESFILLQFENRFQSNPSNGCVEFYFDELEIQVMFSDILVHNGWASNMTVHSDHISWDYADLKNQEQRVLYIPIQGLVSNGSSLEMSANILPNCENPISVEVKPQVQGWPHDPNLLQVTNTDRLSHSNTCVSQHNTHRQTLVYFAQFQNDGDAPATNVIVDDFFGPEYDLSTLQVISSSHTMTNVSTAGQKASFKFYGINLPGSKQNVPYDETVGWFTFKICLKEYITIAQCVTNRISIVFDTQPPVEIEHTICESPDDDCPNPCKPLDVIAIDRSAKAEIYPNPVSEKLHISGEIGENPIVTISDASGRIVAKYDLSLGFNRTINVSNLEVGIYFVDISSDVYKQVHKIIKN